ncbi:type II CAAX endopeptidase family protein [Tissierella creatinophila]|uniref:CAAX amino terminal protease self-immunity n=1 Tax=Tissierella creatinophila DSM 6911 TaxID=1123403 RepID=A0A1U7M502_TISCR|nr:type II CAAX endopeptidase family protein [Tissierella creatinophila]OLS02393.1 CAAX amino terminal protease self- immunity [Tissierella creatinophila DSM 6911]
MRIREELSIYKTNLLYFILAMVFLLVGGMTQNVNIFFGVLVTEVLIIALPSIMFVKLQGLNLKKVFRLNKIEFKNIILIFFITILVYPISVFFQTIFVSIIDLLRPLNPDIIPLPVEISQTPFLWAVFFVAVLPGICEEIMFRGTILRAYEKIGIKRAIIITAILFGMFHFNIINFIGPTILGIVFGIMVYKTNSIYSSMIGHTLNNSIALVLNYFMMKNMDTINNISGQETDVDTLQTIMAFAIVGVFILLLIKIVKTLLNKLTPSTVEYLEEIETEYVHNNNFLSYTPIIIVSIMFFIFNFMFIFI